MVSSLVEIFHSHLLQGQNPHIFEQCGFYMKSLQVCQIYIKGEAKQLKRYLVPN